MSQTIQHTSQAFAVAPLSLDTRVDGDLEGPIQRLRLVVDNLHSTLDALAIRQSGGALPSQIWLDAVPAAVLVLDRQGTVVESNAATRKLLGENPNGQLWRELLPRLFRKAGEAGELIGAEGSYFTLATQPLPGDQGQVILLNDVSETHTLRQRVERRSRLEAIGEMFTRLAHQLGSPLATLKLCFEQAAARETDQPNWLIGAEGAVEHVLALVRELQIFVQGGGAYSEKIALQELLQRLHMSVRPRLQAAGAGLHYGLMPAVDLILNPDAVQSALCNLIDNALLAKPEGAEIVLTAELQNSRLRLYLMDNGPGIPQAVRERIFEPFFTTRAQGTGLGLAVAQSVLQAAGGCLQLAPGTAAGACFIIELPIATGEEVME